jgi:hypothetical protein
MGNLVERAMWVMVGVNKCWLSSSVKTNVYLIDISSKEKMLFLTYTVVITEHQHIHSHIKYCLKHVIYSSKCGDNVKSPNKYYW